MGAVIAVGEPLFMAYLSSAHGISGYPQDSVNDLRDFVFWVVSSLVIAGFALVVWLEMIRFGKLAWLWAAPWVLFAAITLCSSLLDALTGEVVGDRWFGAAMLALYCSQVWVAWKAWKLSKDVPTMSGESVEICA